MDSLEVLFAKRFIQRRDVKAIQFSDGSWSPDTALRNLNGYAPLGFQMQHLTQHLNGTHTYGHYLLDANDRCRVFVLDIDLRKADDGSWVEFPKGEMSNEEFDAQTRVVTNINPRRLWADRTNVQARTWFKYQMRVLADRFCRVIQNDLRLPCVSSYSGSKGVHVYGFLGDSPAKEVREAALLVLDLLDEFEATRGNNFFRHKDSDPRTGFQNFEIEVFPKQDTLAGKDLGNLVRLPLGRNLKSNDPTFFLDMRAPLWSIQPHPNPASLLESGNPYID